MASQVTPLNNNNHHDYPYALVYARHLVGKTITCFSISWLLVFCGVAACIVGNFFLCYSIEDATYALPGIITFYVSNGFACAIASKPLYFVFRLRSKFLAYGAIISNVLGLITLYLFIICGNDVSGIIFNVTVGTTCLLMFCLHEKFDKRHIIISFASLAIGNLNVANDFVNMYPTTRAALLTGSVAMLCLTLVYLLYYMKKHPDLMYTRSNLFAFCTVLVIWQMICIAQIVIFYYSPSLGACPKGYETECYWRMVLAIGQICPSVILILCVIGKCFYACCRAESENFEIARAAADLERGVIN
jgi:hypothetical protein